VADEFQRQSVTISRALSSQEKFGVTLALLEIPRGAEKAHQTIVKLPRQPDEGFGVEIGEDLRVCSVLRPSEAAEPRYDVDYQAGAVRARGLSDNRCKAKVVIGRWGLEISPEQPSKMAGTAQNQKMSFTGFSCSYLTIGSWEMYTGSICIQNGDRAITLFTKQGQQVCNSMMAAASKLKAFLKKYGRESFIEVSAELAADPSRAGIREGMCLIAVNR